MRSEERVVLVNLSQRGCCVEAAEPLGTTNVVLQWEGFEAFGENVWADAGLIGIRFEQPIPYEWVLATREAAASAPPVGSLQDARLTAKAWVEGKRPV